ncbi:MAG: hypothetical protein LCH84_18685 [Gemmatimonadetes bacterium]|nr:hypothetical protein [Gemmatimonadota bacterium]
MTSPFPAPRRARTIALAVALVGAAGVLTPVGAQTLGAQTGNAPSEARQVISINPFLPILGYFQGEYERRLDDNVAFAIAGSYMRFDDYYTNVDAKVRLYPQERGLHGVGVAAGLGYGIVRRRNTYYCDPIEFSCEDTQKRTVSAPTFSVEAHYQWLLGARRATAVAVGGGVKRYFIGDRDANGIERILPTMRLTIGYAFR